MSNLTTMPAKLAAYVGDTYFLECSDQLGSCRDEFARTHGLLFLKPDAIVARAVEPTLDWLHDNDFRVVDARRIVTGRHLVRALWYFQWNIASPQRRRLADILLAVSDSLLLIVADDARELPTTVRLTERKGPTAPAQRAPGELRHLLGGSTYLLNLVHSTDEPADVIRELGIYLGTDERAEAISRAREGSDRSTAAAAIAAELYATTPARSFDTEAAKLAILARAGAELSGLDVDSPAAAWAEAIETLWRKETSADPWDILVVGATVLPMRTPDGSQTLGGVDPTSWYNRRNNEEDDR